MNYKTLAEYNGITNPDLIKGGRAEDSYSGGRYCKRST